MKCNEVDYNYTTHLRCGGEIYLRFEKGDPFEKKLQRFDVEMEYTRFIVTLKISDKQYAALTEAFIHSIGHSLEHPLFPFIHETLKRSVEYDDYYSGYKYNDGTLTFFLHID